MTDFNDQFTNTAYSQVATLMVQTTTLWRHISNRTTFGVMVASSSSLPRQSSFAIKRTATYQYPARTVASCAQAKADSHATCSNALPVKYASSTLRTKSIFVS